MSTQIVYRNTRTLANGFLMVSLILYILSSYFKHTYPIFNYLVAFSEAAIVGGIADWFAVTALFRHPLGLPIPHTAIIPNNKNKIGQNISNFIKENFLSSNYVKENLNKIQISSKFGQIVENNKTLISDKAISLIYHLSKTFKQEELQEYITNYSRDKIESIDIKSIIVKILIEIKEKKQHQDIVNFILLKVQDWLSDKDNEHSVNEQIKTILKGKDKGKSSISSSLKGWLIGEPQLHKYLSDFINYMNKEENKEIKKKIDTYFSLFIADVENTDYFEERIQLLKASIIESIDIDDKISEFMKDINEWVESDLISNESIIKNKINSIIDNIIFECQNNEKLKSWIQEQSLTHLPNFIVTNGNRIDNYFIEYLNKLDSVEISNMIEDKVGDDLQFIRINGTLVGGIIGLSIYSITQFIHYLGVTVL